MAPLVIDPLQSVHIQHHNYQRLLILQRLQMPRQHLFSGPAIQNPCQLIDAGLLHHTLMIRNIH